MVLKEPPAGRIHDPARPAKEEPVPAPQGLRAAAVRGRWHGPPKSQARREARAGRRASLARSAVPREDAL